MNTHTYLKHAIPWPNGYESLWPRSHSCCSRPQSEDLQAAAGETQRTWTQWWVIQCLYETREEVPHYFWTWERKKKNETKKTKQWDTQRSQRGSWCADVGRVCETWTEPMQRHTQETVQKICNIHRGINYLLKTGPDLLSFCSSAMFAPLFSKRKEKVHVRD